MRPAGISATADRDARKEAERLDQVFFAISDPVRRAILERLEERPRLVSELAEPFDISLQAVSRHIQVLVKAGLVSQERSGRISRCSLAVGPIYSAALWINRYSKYWQERFDALASVLDNIDKPKAAKLARRERGKGQRS
jgi:DNA-binding transcriptional ArsR family regulator